MLFCKSICQQIPDIIFYWNICVIPTMFYTIFFNMLTIDFVFCNFPVFFRTKVCKIKLKVETYICIKTFKTTRKRYIDKSQMNPYDKSWLIICVFIIACRIRNMCINFVYVKLLKKFEFSSNRSTLTNNDRSYEHVNEKVNSGDNKYFYWKTTCITIVL